MIITWDTLEDYKKAIHDFDKAISLDPDDARFYARRGISYGSSDQLYRQLLKGLR